MTPVKNPRIKHVPVIATLFLLCIVKCSVVTEDMAKTCITTDPECAALPPFEGDFFTVCTIICSST